jgi:hypothetical protein
LLTRKRSAQASASKQAALAMRRDSNRRNALGRLWKPMLVAAGILAIYTVPLGNLVDLWNPNEASRVMLGVALAERGTVQVDSIIDAYGVVPEDLSVRDGKAYSDKAPGLSFVSAPVIATAGLLLPRNGLRSVPEYWPTRHLLTWLLVALPVAVFMLAVARHDSASPHRTNEPQAHGLRWSHAFLFAVATPLLTYGSVFFSHVPAGLLIAAALILVGRWPGVTSAPSTTRAITAGMLCAFAVTTEYPTAILAAVVLVATAANVRTRAALPAFVLGAVVGGLPLLVYNKVAWGAFLTTGYAFKNTANQAAIHTQGVFGIRLPTWEGLWGVLFSARRGMLFYCPLLLAVPVGWKRMWARDRLDVQTSMLAVIAYVTFAAGFVDWEGGWSAACRHLVPLVPLLFVPLSVGIDTMLERNWSAAFAAVLAGVSLTASVLSVAVTPYFPEQFRSPLGEVALRSLGEGMAMRNVISDNSGMRPIIVFAVYATVVVAAATVSLLALVRDRRTRLVAGVTLAATIVLHPVVLWLSAPPPELSGHSPPGEALRHELLRRTAR